MDEMVLTPTEGVPEDVTQLHGKNPWEARKGFGFFGAWFRTIGLSLFGPTKLMRMSGTQTRVGAALWFAVFTLFMYSIVGYGAFFALSGIFALAVGGGGIAVVSFVTGMLYFLAFIGVATLVSVVVWTVGAHVLLLLSGGAPRGFGRTMQAISYGAGANALTAVPLLGFYLGFLAWIWWGISAGFMLAEGHRISRTRAMIASLAPPALVLLLWVGAIFWFASAAFTRATGMNAWGGYQEMTALVTPLQSRLLSGNMRHVVELVADGQLTPHQFTLNSSQSDPTTVAIAGLGLEDYVTLNAVDRARSLRAAFDSLPEDVVAYRVGDFVFTHHGVDPGQAGARSFWLVIAWPDPDQNAAPGASDVIWVGDSNGFAMPIGMAQFSSSLAAQNQIRASAGLAPIPDPATVLHGQPATAP